MGSVTEGLVGRSSASAEKDGPLFCDDPPFRVDQAKMSGDLQRSARNYFEPCIALLHGQALSSEKPTFLCVPSQ